jgi:hypothetical protein
MDSEDARDPLSADLIDRIAQVIRGMRFGSVEIVIQDGKVVQIERREKFRLQRSPSA